MRIFAVLSTFDVQCYFNCIIPHAKRLSAFGLFQSRPALDISKVSAILVDGPSSSAIGMI